MNAREAIAVIDETLDSLRQAGFEKRGSSNLSPEEHAGVENPCIDSSKSNITLPSPAIPPLIDSQIHWSFLSHLSLSPSLLKEPDVLRQLLSDLNYHAERDVRHKQRMQRHLQGIKQVFYQPIDWVIKARMQRGD